MDIMLRDAALQVIVTLTEAKPRTMAKAAITTTTRLTPNSPGGASPPGSPASPAGATGSSTPLVREIVTAMFQMCMEVDGDTPLDGLHSVSVESASVADNGVGDESEFGDGDELNQTPSTVALFVLDRVAIALPNKYVFPVARDAAMAGIGSGAPKAMSAALLRLGALLKAALQPYPRPSFLLELVFTRCASHADIVRGAACHLLSMLCIYASGHHGSGMGYTKQILDMCLGLLSTDTRHYTRSKCYTFWRCFASAVAKRTS